jgi:predicted PurR-regulated permease PerM
MTENAPENPDTSAAAEPAASVASASPAAAEPPAGRVFWGRVASPFSAGLFLTLGGLAAFVIGVAVSNLSTVIIYVAFALFAALGLDPILKWLERRGVSRVWGIVILFFGVAVVLIGILWLVVPTVVSQIASFVKDIPSTISDFTRTDAYHWLEGMFGAGLNDLLKDAQTFLTNPANIAAIGGGALQVGATIFSGISGVLIVLVLTLYFVASLDTIKTSFYRLAPARNRPGVAKLTEEITQSVGSYLMGMVILAFFNAIVAFFLHLFLGLPFPLLMGVLAFVITIIPLVGPVIYWIAATALALFTGPLAALIFGLAYLVYIQIEAYVLTPRVMSKAISIPGSLVVIGALIGGTLLGLLGALVAVPVTASILLIIKQVFIPKQDAKL